MALVHDNLYASKGAIVFFGIDMVLRTAAMSIDDGRDTGLAGIGSVVGDGVKFSCDRGQRLKDHTKFRERARFRVKSHEELHHVAQPPEEELHCGAQPPEPQERWNSIQQTRSPWRSYLWDHASITRCKAVVRYRTRETNAGSKKAKTQKRKIKIQ